MHGLKKFFKSQEVYNIQNATTAAPAALFTLFANSQFPVITALNKQQVFSFSSIYF